MGTGMPAVPMARIAVAVDGSKYAENALATGIELASRYHSQLTVLTVAPLTAYVVSTEPWVPTEVLEGEIRHYKSILSAAVERAHKEGVPTATGVCLEGHIAEELVAYLEKTCSSWGPGGSPRRSGSSWGARRTRCCTTSRARF